jgi:hypothetical protein
MNKNLSLKDVLLGKVRLGPMHPKRHPDAPVRPVP